MSLYSFIDVTGATGSTGAQDKPTEALKINGQFIEDKISGYRTLYVKGREAMFAEADSYEVGLRDGTILQSRRFPERVITIGYQLICSSASAFRTAFNQLNTLLNVKDAQLIFNDELDKYFIGTPIEPDEVDPGSNSVVGEFSIVCNDPFKYSTTLTTVQTTSKSETITDDDGNTTTVTSQVLTTDNTGGYKAFPAFQVQFATDEDASGDLGSDADCGYVLFAKGGTDYSVQIGDDQEKDTGNYTVINHHFKANARGSFNDDNTISPPSGASWAFNGSSGINNNGLWLNTTTNVSKKWHGPLVVRTIPDGYEASGDFSVSWRQLMCCHGGSSTATGKKACGGFYILLLDASNNVKFAYGIVKKATNTLKGQQYIYNYVNGWSSPASYDLSFTGKLGYTATSQGKERLITCSFTRKLTYDDNNNLTSCKTIIKNAYGTEYALVENEPCTIKKIAVFFGKYDSNTYFYTNKLKYISYVNGNADVINTFRSGDYAEVDCNNASIKLNNMPADSIGDVGNDWEDLYLDPGTNTIYVQHSPWVEQGYEPTVTMTYRKRWI